MQYQMLCINGEVKPVLTGLLHDLFQYLYGRVGEVCSRDEIAVHLYGHSSDGVSDNRIDALVTRLRKELEPDPGNSQYVKTVRGRGFRLVLAPEDEMN